MMQPISYYLSNEDIVTQAISTAVKGENNPAFLDGAKEEKQNQIKEQITTLFSQYDLKVLDVDSKVNEKGTIEKIDIKTDKLRHTKKLKTAISNFYNMKESNINISEYAGNELKGKSIGVIGLGAIGVLVANICNRLGMKVYGYDPYVSVRSAWSLSRMVKHIASIDELFETCDYITIHVPYMDSTKGMINKEAIDKMKDGVTLLNFARGELVDNQAVIEGLASGKVKHYVTDFPSAEIAGVDKVITIPHLGASTEESEENCAEMAVDQLMNYLENGNIVNSVNYPNCDLGEASGAARITVHHKNLPNMIGQLTAILAADGHNISNMLNKSKGEWAYSMFDMEKKAPTEETIKKMEQIDGVVRVRVL